MAKIRAKKPARLFGNLYDPDVYAEDKLMGRRTLTGAKPLKSLKPKHKRLIALHLEGLSNNMICQILDMSPGWVSTMLKDPLVKDIVDDAHSEVDRELKGLMPKAVQSLRKWVNVDNHQASLRAADMILKTQGKYEKEVKDDQSAEDVIRELLRIRSEGPVDITIATERKVL